MAERVLVVRLPVLQGFLQKMLVLGLLAGCIDERGVGRRVGRAIGFEGFEIAGIGDYGSKLFQLVELIHTTSVL